MKTLAMCTLLLLIAPLVHAQEAQVTTFKHTLRWLEDSGFPNYFIDHSTRGLIWEEISETLKNHLEVEHVVLPEKVDYKIITGFGKPKNEPSAKKNDNGFSIDIFSVLTRATTGVAVFWSVEVVVKDMGRVVQQKKAKCEIENANTAAYLEDIRWLTPHDFRKIFSALFAEALGAGEPLGKKVVVGSVEEKEKEVRLWFPNSTRYWLKTNGAIQSGERFSAVLTNEQDTIVEMNYRVKERFFEPISGKEILAELFTDLTGVGTDYTFEHQEIISGLLEFSNGELIKIQLEWIAEITGSTLSDELTTYNTVPLIGQIMDVSEERGEFVYETVREVLSTETTKEKFSVFSGTYTENSFGTSFLHRINGTWSHVEFSVEYNELFGVSDIRMDNEILASMIFQNCNPENLRASNKSKVSKNKKFVFSSSSGVGKPKMNKTEKQEWFPLLIKNEASQKEIEQSCALMVCLFFAMARM